MLNQKIKQMAVSVVSVAVVIAAGASRVTAHHGWSEYDNKQTLNLTGEIQAVGYDNPHATIQLQTADEKWQVVLAPPSRLQSRGLPPDKLQVGETVSIVGYPHRSEDNELRAERIVIDENTVELR